MRALLMFCWVLQDGVISSSRLAVGVLSALRDLPDAGGLGEPADRWHVIVDVG